MCMRLEPMIRVLTRVVNREFGQNYCAQGELVWCQPMRKKRAKHRTTPTIKAKPAITRAKSKPRGPVGKVATASRASKVQPIVFAIFEDNTGLAPAPTIDLSELEDGFEGLIAQTEDAFGLDSDWTGDGEEVNKTLAHYVRYVAKKWNGKTLRDPRPPKAGPKGAAKAGVAKAKLKAGGKQTKPSAKEIEKLYQAIRFGSDPASAIRAFVEAGGPIDTRSERSWGGRTLLQEAGADLELAQWLIEQGADVNATAEDLSTAIHYSLQSPDVFEVLIAAGANINAADHRGWTALHMVCYGMCTPMGMGLRDADADRVLELLLAAGADPTIETTKPYSNMGDGKVAAGSRPAACALVEGNLDRLLRLKAANAIPPDSNGNTLLHLAAANKSVTNANKVAFLAGKLGIAVDAQNHYGWTAMHYACWDIIHFDFLKELVTRGASRGLRSTQTHKRIPAGALPIDVARKASNFAPTPLLAESPTPT